MEGIRKRFNNNNSSQNKDSFGKESKCVNNNERYLRQPAVLLFVAFHGALFLLVHGRLSVYPAPRGLDTPSNYFSEARARAYLRGIVSVGNRLVGSYANEKLTVDYLLKELELIKGRLNPVHSLELDSKRVSGSFTLGFLSEFTSVYEGVNNIVAKLSPKIKQNQEALLVNCHYDSAIGSPGVSDDAISCSLMLEVLNVLAQANKPLNYTVIFLFNGAEENILQASHGFITQHPWAGDVKAFVNLEAAGAGGWELLFQAGPEHPWLLRSYVENVPYPSASVVGQELFQSDIIPSDTDFRIFRDFGNIPGMDIAYISNGYVYHTKYDDESRIPAGCIQRGGENLLALVRAIANSDQLRDPGEDRHGHLVFFDLLGLTMVVYPKRIGEIINITTVVLVMLTLLYKTNSSHRQVIDRIYHFFKLFKAMVLLFLSWILLASFAGAMGSILYFCGHPMTWFTNTWLLIGLFVVPEIGILLVTHRIAKKVIFKNESIVYVSSLFHSAVLIIFSLALIVLTTAGLCSAALVLIWVLFPWLVQQFSWGARKTDSSDGVMLGLHIISLFLPCVVLHHFLHDALGLFVPIMGRSGADIIPDVFVGLLVTLGVIILTSYHVQFIYLLDSVKQTLFVLLIIFVTVLFAALYTPLGFPYRANPVQPTCQRHVIQHVDRKFHDITGATVKHDSHIWFIVLDSNELHLLSPHIPHLSSAKEVHCDEVPYCGWPYYFPVRDLLRKTYELPASPLTLHPSATLNAIKYPPVNNVHRVQFNISGPDHMSIYLLPEKNVSIVSWSIGSHYVQPSYVHQSPDGAYRPSYFVYYSYGQQPAAPFSFWVDLRVSESVDVNQGILQVALAGHYFSPQNQDSAELHAIVSAMPDWTVPLSWLATYENWII